MNFILLDTINSNNLIYGLIDPNTNELFYIGKTIQGIERIRQHFKFSNLKFDGNTRKANKIRKLQSNNQITLVAVLYQFNGNFDKKTCNEILYKKEQELIDFYRMLGYDLTNLDDGGPGCTGRAVSEITSKKMSESAKKRGLNEFLLNQQKSKFQDPSGLKICSTCLIAKPLNEISRSKKSRTCKSCFNENRPSRIIPGARKSFVEKQSYKVSAKNCLTGEIIIFSSMHEACRKIGGKINRTNINVHIKKQTPYYGFIWSKI